MGWWEFGIFGGLLWSSVPESTPRNLEGGRRLIYPLRAAALSRQEEEIWQVGANSLQLLPRDHSSHFNSHFIVQSMLWACTQCKNDEVWSYCVPPPPTPSSHYFLILLGFNLYSLLLPLTFVSITNFSISFQS